jgi:tRNA (cmo5U34)-methyltransferase
VAQFHWDPERYLELIRQEVPDYDRLQDVVVTAAGADARRVLELGTGTGESARRVLEANPRARLVGIDANGEMLARARALLPGERVRLIVGRLEGPLPDGPFDLVVSVLAVHHLDDPGKAGLFPRIASVLAPQGRFVLGDVVVPADPADVLTPIDGVYDKPSSVPQQVRWLQQAGLRPHVQWAHRDLAVIVAERQGVG